jgi:hypothetical protein
MYDYVLRCLFLFMLLFSYVPNSPSLPFNCSISVTLSPSSVCPLIALCLYVSLSVFFFPLIWQVPPGRERLPRRPAPRNHTSVRCEVCGVWCGEVCVCVRGVCCVMGGVWRVVCGVWCVACGASCAAHDIRCVACRVLRGVRGVRCVVCAVWCVVCGALCCVWCVACGA